MGTGFRPQRHNNRGGPSSGVSSPNLANGRLKTYKTAGTLSDTGLDWALLQNWRIHARQINHSRARLYRRSS